MKKILVLTMAAALFLASCEKDNNDAAATTCNNPHNAAPASLTGGWANGFTSFTQIIDAYDGHIIGNSWQSGKYFKFTGDGLGAEFYYMAASPSMQLATKATGTIAFLSGSDAESGAFTFHPCYAHFKGFGPTNVDRDATPGELNSLTITYNYLMDGTWLRIEPGGPVNSFSSSFRLVN